MTDTRSVPEGWNRNAHYHDRLLAALPVDCRRVLDVGCGLGTFARRLARVVEHVDALDRDRDALAQAERLSRDLPTCALSRPISSPGSRRASTMRYQWLRYFITCRFGRRS